MRSLLFSSFVALLPGLVGCRSTAVEPIPWNGEAPETIAVWPGLSAGFASLERPLLHGLGEAVRRRGYHAVTPEMARARLAGDEEWVPGRGGPTDVRDVGMRLGADAVLVVKVRAFAAESDPRRRLLRAAAWDLGWNVFDARSGALLWSYEHAGTWRRPTGEPFDPLKKLDGLPDPVPIGGDGERYFRDRDELIETLHWLALRHLPARPETPDH